METTAWKGENFRFSRKQKSQYFGCVELYNSKMWNNFLKF